MDPEAKQSKKEDEADNVTDENNDQYDKKIQDSVKRQELLEEHEDIDHRTNMWRYNIATIKAQHRFCNLFKDLVMKYLRSVKGKHPRRALDSKTILKIILDELDILGLIRKESEKGDPDKFIVSLYDIDKAELINKNTPMFMMLEKETEIEDFEDSVAHDRSKLRDFGIDNDSEIDETNKCEKPSTSSTEQEKLTLQRIDKFPTFKKALEFLDDEQIKMIDNICISIFGKVDLEKITTPQNLSLQTPTQKEHKELDTTSVQTSISPTVSGVKRHLSHAEHSGPSTSESSLSEVSKRGSLISPSQKSVLKKLEASKSPSPSASTSVGLSQAKQKTPKYAHVRSTIPKSTSAAKKPTSAKKPK